MRAERQVLPTGFAGRITIAGRFDLFPIIDQETTLTHLPRRLVTPAT